MKLEYLCTHRNDKCDTLIREKDGSYVCKICGRKIKDINVNDFDSIKESAEVVKNTIEMLKIFCADDSVSVDYIKYLAELQSGIDDTVEGLINKYYEKKKLI